MDNLKKWLDKKGIGYRNTPEWSLIFEGNYCDGVYISGKHAAEIRRYNQRNKGFAVEFRCGYETIYAFPAKG